MIEKTATNKDEIKARRAQHNKQVYKSRFGFLNETHGVRPSSFIGLMGTAGSGKSTLIKSIVSDCALNEPVLCYLTEEKSEDYEMHLHFIGANMEHVSFIEENESAFGDLDIDGAIAMILEPFFMSESKIIFFDNITTSVLYEKFGYKGQCKLISALRAFCNDSGKTIFFVAHTKKGSDNNGHRLFTGDDIRGTYQSFQQAEYFYILQPVNVRDQVFPLIQIAKHRFHDEIKSKFYLLGYKDKQYKFDMPVGFEKIKEIFKKRNVLK